MSRLWLSRNNLNRITSNIVVLFNSYDSTLDGRVSTLSALDDDLDELEVPFKGLPSSFTVGSSTYDRI